MTTTDVKQARQARVQRVLASLWQVGGRVRHIEDKALGTIVETNWSAVKVKWDDGQVGTLENAKANRYLQMVKF